jgi:hypothetical protein
MRDQFMEVDVYNFARRLLIMKSALLHTRSAAAAEHGSENKIFAN